MHGDIELNGIQSCVATPVRLPFFANSARLHSIASQKFSSPNLSFIQIAQEKALWHQINSQQPDIVLLGADNTLLKTRAITRLDLISKRPVIIALIDTTDEATLTECYKQGADRVVIMKYCTAEILTALLRTFSQREPSFPPYQIRSNLQTFSFDNVSVRLTKKTFDLAQYLFLNHGELLSKSTILRDVWGLESNSCLTRRVEVQISHIRKALALDGTHGWELKVRRRVGYGVFEKTPEST